MTINGKIKPNTTGTAGTPELFMPMIYGVSLSDSTEGNPPHIVRTDLVALIDTGSDFCRIDRVLAASLPSLKYLGEMSVIGATGPAGECVYSLQIIVGDVQLPVFCLTASLRSSGSLSDLLFGMDAIRHFDLRINRSLEQVSLTWIG
jgi:hypothetical protein